MTFHLSTRLTTFLLVFGLFAVSSHTQEFGELQQLLGFAYGNQLNSMLSACCVIRDLECPVRRYPTLAGRQGSSTMEHAVKRFEQCACTVGRQCLLTLPPKYMPDGAFNMSLDITFVTSASTTRYICTYERTRVLLCRLHSTVATGILGLGFPGLNGGLSPLAAFGGLGGMGEEMEEIVEQMVESGIPPPQPQNKICPRCVPLHCALRVTRSLLAMRVSGYGRNGTGVPFSQQEYHRCLRMNGIRPPSLDSPPPATPAPTATSTIDTDTDSDFTTTTTARPTTRANILTAKPSTTTTAAPLIYTTRTSVPPLVVVTTPSAVFTSPATTAGLDTTVSSPAVVGGNAAVVNVTQPSSAVLTSTAKKPLTTSQPEEITRILVGNVPGTTSLLPQKNGAVTENGSALPEGGGGVVTGVLVGVLSIVALLTAFFIFLYWRRRRRSKEQRRHLDDMVTSPAGKGEKPKGSLKHKAASLPSVSSKRAVIDSEERVAVEDDFGNNNHNNGGDDDASVEYSERYTPDPTSSKSPSVTSTPSVSTNAGDDENVYATLDEATVIPSRNSATKGNTNTKAENGLSKAGVGDSTTGSDVNTTGSDAKESKGKQDSKNYYNTRPLFTLDGESSKVNAAPARSSSNKYHNKQQSAANVHGSGNGHPKVSKAESNGSYTPMSPPIVREIQYEAPRPRGPQVHTYTGVKHSGDATQPTGARPPMPTPNQPTSGAIYSEPYTLPASVRSSQASNLGGMSAQATRRGSNASNVAEIPGGPNVSEGRRSNNASSVVVNSASENNSRGSKNPPGGESTRRRGSATASAAAAVDASSSAYRRQDSNQKDTGRTTGKSSEARQNSNNNGWRREGIRTTGGVDADGYLVPLPPRGQQPRL